MRLILCLILANLAGTLMAFGLLRVLSQGIVYDAYGPLGIGMVLNIVAAVVVSR